MQPNNLQKNFPLRPSEALGEPFPGVGENEKAPLPENIPDKRLSQRALLRPKGEKKEKRNASPIKEIRGRFLK